MFTENFEIVIVAGEADEIYTPNGYRPEFINSILEDLNIEGFDTSNVRTEIRSYGYGADAITLAIIMDGLKNILNSEENNLHKTEEWFLLGKKLTRAIIRLKKRQFGVRISEPLAAALAITNLTDIDQKSIISLFSSTIIYLPNASLKSNLGLSFEYQPDR